MPSSTKKTGSKAKPYDRPAKGKAAKSAKPAAGLKAAAALPDVGAPAQLSQTSRKGKKAWRKNVDVRAEEQALEAARAEERLTGGAYTKKADGELFSIDTTGDVEGESLPFSTSPLQS